MVRLFVFVMMMIPAKNGFSSIPCRFIASVRAVPD
jgi:hypothetical protein